MIAELSQFMQKVDESPAVGVIECQGAGGAGHHIIVCRMGSTATILETQFRQSPQSIRDWLKFEPESYCNARVTRQAAMQAYCRSVELGGNFGIAVNGTLKTHRPHKGDHRFHVAAQTADRTFCTSTTLEKGRRNRDTEEVIVAREMLYVMAQVAGVPADGFERALPDNRTDGERDSVVIEEAKAPEDWQALMAGSRSFVASEGFEVVHGRRYAILPASLDPLHDGHLEMLRKGAELTGLPACFEVSVFNADKKPPLDYIDMERITAEVKQAGAHVVFSRAPTFVEKARLYPESCHFLVGWDTFARVADGRFYLHLYDLERPHSAVSFATQEFADRRSRFRVFGRVDEAGQFRNLSTRGDLDVTQQLAWLCDEVSEDVFRMDVSSTGIRQTRARATEPAVEVTAATVLQALADMTGDVHGSTYPYIGVSDIAAQLGCEVSQPFYDAILELVERKRVLTAGPVTAPESVSLVADS